MVRAWVIAVLVSAPVLAGERVRVAVHPLVAPGIDDAKLVNDLNREVLNILADTQHVAIVAAEDVDKRLAEEGGRCPSRGKERLECLERVALATRADYAVAVVVKRLGKEYELSGTIACSDRVALEQPANQSATDNGSVKIDSALKHQLRVLLLDGLKVAALPSDPRLRNPPPASSGTPPPVIVENHPPAEVTRPAETGTPTLRIASYVSGVFAVGCGVGALALGLSANSHGSGLAEDTRHVLTDPGQVDQVTKSRNEATLAGIMGGVAGVAAVAAVAMFMMSPAEEPRVVVAPLAGPMGAGVGISGRFQ